MLKTDALAHFHSTIKLAAAMTAAGYPLTRHAVSMWGERVPELAARRLHEMTRGRLRFRPEDYQKWRECA